MKQRDDVSEYEALLALSRDMTPEAREYIVRLLGEHRTMRVALEEIAVTPQPSLAPRLAVDALAKVSQ